MASQPDLGAELELLQACLLGDLAQRRRARVLVLLDAAAGRLPPRPALAAKQQHAVLLVEQQDAHGFADAGLAGHAPHGSRRARGRR